LLATGASTAHGAKFYYVGGPNPGTSGDGSWEWRTSGIQDAYDWIQTNGAGDDWEIRVHSSYAEDVGAGSIELTFSTVPVTRVRGGMTWQTGTTEPLNVQQDLGQKTEVTGSGDVFLVHNVYATGGYQPVVLEGFDIAGSVNFRNNAAGSRLVHCHVSGQGTGTGVYVGDTSHKVYLMNTLVEGFDTGLLYRDIVAGRSVYVVHCTLADNAVGVSNDNPPWTGRLQFFNSVIAADHTPVDPTSNIRFYSYTDVFDGDGSFVFDGSSDIDVGGSLLADPLLEADFALGAGSPCLETGEGVDGGAFTYVDVDPSVGFQADGDVVVAGTPPGNAEYVLLLDALGEARLAGTAPDMGAFEGVAGSEAPVAEPSAVLLAALGLAGMAARRRR
jgi:hypothetical protein